MKQRHVFGETARTTEWPTLLLAAAIYGGWTLATLFHDRIPPLLLAVLGDEALEAPFDAVDPRQSADPFLHVGEGEFRLRRGEQAKSEEPPARKRRQEIGIAAPGIQHRHVGLAGSQLDEFVLQLEGAQFGELAVVGHFISSDFAGAIPAKVYRGLAPGFS